MHCFATPDVDPERPVRPAVVVLPDLAPEPQPLVVKVDQAVDSHQRGKGALQQRRGAPDVGVEQAAVTLHKPENGKERGESMGEKIQKIPKGFQG